MLVGNQVAQRTADEKFELIPVLTSDHPGPRSKRLDPLSQ
jgi:hypothetical protein